MLFLSDVNLGLFHFYSVTQWENIVLALKNAFSNSDWLTLVVSVSRYYLNKLISHCRLDNVYSTTLTPHFKRNKKILRLFKNALLSVLCIFKKSQYLFDTDMKIFSENCFRHTLPGQKYKNGIFDVVTSHSIFDK